MLAQLVGNAGRREVLVSAPLPSWAWATWSPGHTWALGLSELPCSTAGQHTKRGAQDQRTSWTSPRTTWKGAAVQAALGLACQQRSSEAGWVGPHPPCNVQSMTFAVRARAFPRMWVLQDPELADRMIATPTFAILVSSTSHFAGSGL